MHIKEHNTTYLIKDDTHSEEMQQHVTSNGKP